MVHNRNKRSGSGYRVRPTDRLSTGQKIFLTVMSISLIAYVAIQLMRTHG